jgi:hypothetical protein
MKLNQDGAVSGVTISLVLSLVLLIASVSFGVWAFSGRQKYKNNTDQLISTAVSSAKQQQQNSDNQAFAIAEQKPLIQYLGPQQYGTISLWYPRTWSSFVDSSGGASEPLDGYFAPGTLPSVTDDGNTNFALRIQVESTSYSDTVQDLQSEQQANQVTITAYSLPKLPKVVGIEAVGLLPDDVTGTMVVLPLRGVAVEVWTEGTAYLSQFNNDILPNLSFSP